MEEKPEQLLKNARLAAGNIQLAAVRSQVLAQIAEAYLQINNSTEFESSMAEALKTADLLKHPDEKAKQLAWLARLLQEAGDPARAREEFKRAYYLARASESLPQKVNALYNLASEYLDAGLAADSKTILVELEPLVLDPASEVDTVCELINIAEIYTDMDETGGAAESLKKAVQAARALKDPWFKAERLIEIAGISNSDENNTQAAGLIQEALNEIEHLEENSRSYFWLKLASLYNGLDLKTQAAECLVKAREAVFKSDDPNTAAGDALELAESYLHLDDRSAALAILESEQAIIDGLPDHHDQILRLLKAAGLFSDLGLNASALKSAEKVYELSRGETDIKARLYTLGQLAILYVNLKKSEKAAELIEEISRTVIESKTRTSGLGAIAEELIAAGDLEMALNLEKIIREPEVRAEVLIAAAKNQIDNQPR